MSDDPDLSGRGFPQLSGRSFLALANFDPSEIAGLIDLAAELKARRAAGTETPGLSGKSIALIFEKDSTRTRVGFELAAYEQGMHVTYLGPTGSHIGHKETVKDTARVLGRLYDAIEYRGFAQETVETLAQWSGVPVYNGLTDDFHPTQILADFLTMLEHADRQLHEVSYCYLGDAANNMGDSLLIGGAKMGMDVRLAAPKSLWPRSEIVEKAEAIAKQTRAKLTLTEDPREGVSGAQFVYTDVWLSMGEPEQKWKERIDLLKPYQVNAELMAATGMENARFMHCLPALHNAETEVGARIKEMSGMDSMEVTEDVFESSASVVFDQAENRMHTIKAVLVATIAGSAP